MLIHHTVNAYSEFQLASALNSEKDDSEIAHLLEVRTVMEIQTETNNAPLIVSSKIKRLLHIQ